jgi:transposase
LDFGEEILFTTREVIPMAKRVYSSVGVKTVSVERLLPGLSEGTVWVGLDIGKEVILAVPRDGAGAYQRAWKVRQPSELGELVSRVVELARHRAVVVAMESTGTYGDALRQALWDAGIAVVRVSGKSVKDYAEIFDGVPSNHDAKDAAMIAELASLGKSRAWPYRPLSAWEGEMRREVGWLDAQQRIRQIWLGRLEGMLARHWPEATRVLKLISVTLHRTLAHYGDPRRLAEDGEASARVRQWGGRFLKEGKVAALLESARTTVGVRMTEQERLQMQAVAKEVLRAERAIRGSQQALRRLASQEESVQRQAEAVGAPTACVLRVAAGEVKEYSSGPAYRKALGMNLKERSSGKYQGKLKVTKRGSSLGRRWLFYAAMRILQRAPVRSWYEAKKARDGGSGMKGVVAVMRKLVLALYAVGARGEKFDAARLFPGRPRATEGSG